MIEIRSPRPAEAAVVVELILQSDCGTLPALFGPGVRGLLAHLFARDGNPYSASNALVAADRDGTVLGAAVGAPAAASRAAALRAAAQLAAWYGPALAVRLPRLARAGRATGGLDAGDFYLAHIAVQPGSRGNGIGTRLLAALEDRARAQGTGRVVLDVEEHNERARSFYDRLAYRPCSTVRIELGRHGTFALIRMAREL